MIACGEPTVPPTVQPLPPTPPPNTNVVAVRILNPDPVFEVADTAQLVAVAFGAQNSADSVLNWTIRDPSVASLDNTGRLIGLIPDSVQVIVRSAVAPDLADSTLVVVRNLAPEESSAQVVSADTVSEGLSTFGDVDEFVLDSSVGPFFQMSAALLEGGATDSLVVEVLTPGGAQARIDGPGPALSARITLTGDTPDSFTSSPRVAHNPSNPHRIRVRGSVGVEYAFVVTPINPAPESAETEVAVGDTIAEMLSLGDIDTFTFEPIPNQLYAVFLQTIGLDAGTVSLRVSSFGETVATVESGGDVGNLLINNTGRFSVPTAVPVTMEVRGLTNAADQASYRVFVMLVDSKPELAADTIVLGELVFETITPATDIDEFVFIADTSQLVSITGRLTEELTDPFLVMRFRSRMSSGQGLCFQDPLCFDVNVSSTTPTISGFERFPVGGVWGVTVASSRAIVETGYSLQISVLSTDPESAPSVLPFGTAVTEVLTRSDVDQFTITGQPGDTVIVRCRGVGSFPPESFAQMSFVERPIFEPLGLVDPFSGQDYPNGITLCRDRGFRFLWPFGLPELTVNVMPQSGPSGQFFYELAFDTIPSAPEAGQFNIALGDSAVHERLEFELDVDDFNVTVPDQREVTFEVEFFPGDTRSILGRWFIEVLDDIGNVLTNVRIPPRVRNSQGQVQGGLAEFSLDLDPGDYRVRVFTNRINSVLFLPGPYRVIVR